MFHRNLMNTDLLVVLGMCARDAARAEQLIDWCYALSGNLAIGHALLAVTDDVHAEMVEKCGISAGLAFASHQIVRMPKLDTLDLTVRTNKLFQFAAMTVQRGYRVPWLWLEPDCVPLQRGWQNRILEVYQAQPKRFFGPHLRLKAGEKEKTCLGRVSVYPPDAAADMKLWMDAPIPFHLFAGEKLSDCSTKCRLIQQTILQNEADFDKLRPDAMLVHSDKTGRLISHLRHNIEIQIGIQSESNQITAADRNGLAPKVDKRTKAWRAMKAQQKAT